jgi:hypothetical protein
MRLTYHTEAGSAREATIDDAALTAALRVIDYYGGVSETSPRPRFALAAGVAEYRYQIEAVGLAHVPVEDAAQSSARPAARILCPHCQPKEILAAAHMVYRRTCQTCRSRGFTDQIGGLS